MKNVVNFSVSCIFIAFTVSCSKDEDTIVIQKHDKNQMMTIMHQMMDKMKAMQMTTAA